MYPVPGSCHPTVALQLCTSLISALHFSFSSNFNTDGYRLGQMTTSTSRTQKFTHSINPSIVGLASSQRTYLLSCLPVVDEYLPRNKNKGLCVLGLAA